MCESLSNTLKCSECDKKLSLTAIMCKCKKYYCNKHRYSDKHNCSYDYKNNGRDLLKINNPLIQPNKVDKI